MTEEIMFTMMRVLTGAFFAISGFHKMMIPARHAALVATLRHCGVPFVPFCQWFVPSVELFAGLGVIVGLMTPLAALGLIAILAVAIVTDGPDRVKSYQPINFADRVDDWLYLPEVIFFLVLSFIAIRGAGVFSFDHFIFDFLWTLGGRHA